MVAFTTRTVLDGRAPTSRYLRQTALLAASWHRVARPLTNLEVLLIGAAPERFHAFLRELGVPVIGARPDQSDAFARTANCIAGAVHTGAGRVLLVDNDVCFLAPPEPIAATPARACSAALAGRDRLSPAQWERIEKHLGLPPLPVRGVSVASRYRAVRRRRAPVAMERLYVNAGVLAVPDAPAFASVWSRSVARIHELFADHALGNDAVLASCQAGLAAAIRLHGDFQRLPDSCNYRPLHFVLGDALGETPIALHLTGYGNVSEDEAIVDHLDAYWSRRVVEKLERIRSRIGEGEHERRRAHLDAQARRVAALVREYALDSVVRRSGARADGPARRTAPPRSPTPLEPADRATPCVIGGLGGSGTRAVARIVQGLGVDLGTAQNRALDHLFVTALLKRPRWFGAPIDHAEARLALALIGTATFDGLREGIAPEADRLLVEVRSELAAFRAGGGETGVHEELVDRARLWGPGRLDGLAGWGWKEPNSHVFLEDLLASFPRARYVHVVRHGLDMAFSRNTQQLENWGSLFGIDATPALCSGSGEARARAQLDYWIRSSRAVEERAATDPRVRILRFDALVSEPVREILALAEFLGVPCSEPRARALARHARRPASAERYRDRRRPPFSADQLAAVRGIGFEIEPPRPRPARWWRLARASHA